MCGRFTLILPPESLAEIFGLAELPRIEPRYNIAPSQQVAVVRQNIGGNRYLSEMKWGLIPSWSKDQPIGNHLINARAETLEEKVSFRNAFRHRRCLIPADGFFEWKTEEKRKIPYYIKRTDGSPFAVAGLWDSWKTPEGTMIESCTIITINPNSLVKDYHDRMPVILSRDEYGMWLDRNITGTKQLTTLFQPYPSELLEAYPVSSKVNIPGNDNCECIQRI